LASIPQHLRLLKTVALVEEAVSSTQEQAHPAYRRKPAKMAQRATVSPVVLAACILDHSPVVAVVAQVVLEKTERATT
jgi:hypothetical protein